MTDTARAASVPGTRSTGLPATGSATCVVRPELTEGPYFVDERLNRSDIRSDPLSGAIKPGVPLEVSFNVSRFAANACTPWRTDSDSALRHAVFTRLRGTAGSPLRAEIRAAKRKRIKGRRRFTRFTWLVTGRTVHCISRSGGAPGAERNSYQCLDMRE